MTQNKFSRWILYYVLVFTTAAIVFYGSWYLIAQVIVQDLGEQAEERMGLAIVGVSCIYSIIITGITTIIAFYGYHWLLGLNVASKKRKRSRKPNV